MARVPLSAPRQVRSIRNDERILDAAFALGAEQGWAGMTFPAVAQRAGLSVRPIRDRFADRSELAAAAWVERVHPRLAPRLEGLAHALDLVRKEGLGEVDALSDALGEFVHPDAGLRLSLDLMIVSSYDVTVRGALDSTLLPWLRAWLAQGPGGPGPADAARRAYLLSTALGLAMEGLRRAVPEVGLEAEYALLAQALAAPHEPQQQPTASAEHLDEGFVVGKADPEGDALLRATLEQVGTRGYDAATTAAIARATGRTEGLLFSRYAAKADLFFDATQRSIAQATQMNIDYQARIAAASSIGMSEAVAMRELMRPGRERNRIVALEQYRLVWHDADLRERYRQVQEPVLEAYVASIFHGDPVASRARAHLELARGSGPIMLAQLIPESWQLPYDVVTIPLLDDVGPG